MACARSTPVRGRSSSWPSFRGPCCRDPQELDGGPGGVLVQRLLIGLLHDALHVLLARQLASHGLSRQFLRTVPVAPGGPDQGREADEPQGAMATGV